MDIWAIALWVGKVGLVAFFIMSGVNHFTRFKMMSGYAQSRGVPLPGPAVIVSGLMMLVGSSMILFRWHPIWGAGLLIIFLVAAAFLVHHYWSETEPMAKVSEATQFWKNLTVASGALLFALGVHGGAY
jgi:uncharacterized membrane protein YphA (DoxX/SURF4 family)